MFLYIYKKLIKWSLMTDSSFDNYKVLEYSGVIYILNKDDSTIPPIKVSIDKNGASLDVPYLSSHIPLNFKIWDNLYHKLKNVLAGLLKFVEYSHKSDIDNLSNSDFTVKVLYILSIVLNEKDILKVVFMDDFISAVVSLVNVESNVTLLTFDKVSESLNVTIANQTLDKVYHSENFDITSVIKDKYVLSSHIITHQLSEDVSKEILNNVNIQDDLCFSIYLSIGIPKKVRDTIYNDLIDSINVKLWEVDKCKPAIIIPDTRAEYIKEETDSTIVEYPVRLTLIEKLTSH